MSEPKPDALTISDWERGYEPWMKFIGKRTREVWNTLPIDLRKRLYDDAGDMADEAWNDAIDAMGEDA